jgi:N,N'-diacetyllegionaminate synthase
LRAAMVERMAPAPAERVLIIAEVAQAHDGSLGSAHAYVDAVAKAGADAVKF